MKHNVFDKMRVFGVVPRSMVKNQLTAVAALCRAGVARKAYKRGRVFYELTEKALPALNAARLKLRAEAELRRQLYPRRTAFYSALLEDLRFFDTTKEEAAVFRFLGDWQLRHPPVKSQLQLAQWRYYAQQGLI